MAVFTCSSGNANEGIVMNVAYIEVRDDAEQTLLLFRLDLFSRDHRQYRQERTKTKAVPSVPVVSVRELAAP
jgi:hypothetical protein